MANQMTPDELRAAAANVTSPFPEDDDAVYVSTHDREWWAALKTARDATRRLAVVIDLCEAELATTDPDGLTPSGQVARGILRAARGDTTNENRSE